jgi:DNA-binding response OmpR family regulator
MAKILLVEDDDNLRELVRARLEKNDYKVETACDGYLAVSMARSFAPDLVILDLMIPRMDGYTVCRLLRASGLTELPVIMFSARSGPDDIQRGADMGANAFVSKPFEPEVLLAKIKELLDAKAAKEQATSAGMPPQPQPAKVSA